jgi:hypothetical protein
MTKFSFGDVSLCTVDVNFYDEDALSLINVKKIRTKMLMLV